MYSKADQFSKKKFRPVYFIKKSGKCTKPFSPEGFHNKLDNYKPMNIEYLKYLKKLLKRCIKVYSKEHVFYTCGKNFDKPSIDVMYMKKRLEFMDRNVISIGHFALKNGKDASNENFCPNDCLLRVILAQCGIRSSKIWREMKRRVLKMKSRWHTKNLVYNSQLPVVINVDIVGGAKYSGSSKTDAKRVLDLSQNGQSHPDMKAGHPRGHASYPQAKGPTESVENYSKFDMSNRRVKTGFLSRSDQDFVAHFVLETDETQDAIELLNEEGKNGLKEVVKIPAKNLRIDENKLPKVQEWYNGEKRGNPARIDKIITVMKHHYQKYDDENADVFILTLPTGLIHARILSKIIDRPVVIWQDERVAHVFGRTRGKLAIDAEYHERENGLGHWSLRGGKDAATTSKNACLYEVVASQTGHKSATLRRETTVALRRLRRWPAAGAGLPGAEGSMLGGARYAGRGPADAQRLLDASQNGQCHPEGSSGHPRGHASHPPTGRSDDTVETYSYSRWRSGFLSRADQDLVCHHTLVTDSARDLMEQLNRGQFKVASHIGRNELDYDPLPLAQKWSGGTTDGSPGHFRTVCLVGKHFLNRHNDPQADIFILTFYPIL